MFGLICFWKDFGSAILAFASMPRRTRTPRYEAPWGLLHGGAAVRVPRDPPRSPPRGDNAPGAGSSDPAPAGQLGHPPDAVDGLAMAVFPRRKH